MSEEDNSNLPVKVRLAGFNVDSDGLKELGKTISELRTEVDKKYEDENARTEKFASLVEIAEEISKGLTPETISASYARISRDPRDIPKLREDARKDVDSSRKSNKAIIFTMGHKSIAEHAVFNFDIMGLSRRAIEDLEAKRLQSYTEKSQRYITLDGDFVVPPEIVHTPLEEKFLVIVDKQNRFYNDNLTELIEWHANQNYDALFKALKCETKPDRQRTTVEGLGKEDARYALAMATQAQLGLTTSARNLEDLITRLRSSELEETRAIGELLYNEVDGIAPSVIKYTKPTDFYSKTREELRDVVSEIIKKYGAGERRRPFSKSDDVTLYTHLSRDDSIIAGLLFSSSGLDYGLSLGLVHSLSEEDKVRILNTADKYQEHHDPKLREYELGDRVADIELSSSAFAQIKRHRMNTLISQAYNSELGITIPNSISRSGLGNQLFNIAQLSTELYNEMLQEGLPVSVAEYILTNAHRRRVLFDANNRQVHAFGSERENLPAQWDIRNIANQYHDLIQLESPLTTRSLGGKHAFYEIKEKIQSKYD